MFFSCFETFIRFRYRFRLIIEYIWMKVKVLKYSTDVTKWTNIVEVKVSDRLDNVQNETDELLELLEWLFATKEDQKYRMEKCIVVVL